MKKFLTLFLALMAMLTVFTVAVYADGEESETPTEYYLFLDGKTKTQIFTKTVTTTEGENPTTTVEYNKAGANLKKLIANAATFQSLDTKKATIDEDGVVTPVATGDFKIRVWNADGDKLGDFQFHVITRTVTKMKVEKISKYSEYYVGDKIENDHINVYFDYDNGDENIKAETNEYTLSYEGTNGRLTTPGDSIEVTVKSVNNPVIVSKYGVKVKTNWVKKLTLTLTGGSTNFDEGDVLPGLNITAEYEDGNTTQLSANSCDIQLSSDDKTWETVSTSRLLKTTDKYIRVCYNGMESKSIRIYVTAVTDDDGDDNGDTGDTGDTSECIGMIDGELSTKTYVIGEKIDWTGVSVKLYNAGTLVKTFSSTDLQSLASIYDNGFGRIFTSDDVKGDGKTNLVLSYKHSDGNTYLITVTGLTVKESLTKITVIEIQNVTFMKSAYPTGYEFTKNDISYIYYINGKGSSATLVNEMMDDVANTITVTVLTASGSDKTSNKTKIESSNVYTNDGKNYVKVKIAIDDKSVTKELEVSDPDVEVYYNSSTAIGKYASIDEALAAVEALSLTDYPPIGSVVTIKLTADEKISSDVAIDPQRAIKINLNGKKLSMNSDTVDPDTSYYLEITNTSSTAGTFTYTDKKIDIVLAKNESIRFDNDYDEDDLLPGVYVVTLDVGKNGEVESTPEANDDDEILIGHGSEIKFVITPKKGYMVESIALGTKKVNSSSSGYSEKDGVVTLTFKVDEDTNGKTLKVTFAEDDPLANWENPFSDVKDNADYIDAIAFVNVNGLLQGTSETKFSPTGTLTRAQFVTILGRLCGIDEELADALYGDRASNFKDVSKNDSNYGRYEYAVPYIIWATDEKLIEGHGGNRKGEFGPLDPITHEQMYVIMQRYAEKIEDLNTAAGTQVLQFSDKGSIQSWAVNAVKYAQKMDFIVETGTNKISPSTNAKRWELATLLQKFCINVLGWEGEIADEK